MTKLDTDAAIVTERSSMTSSVKLKHEKPNLLLILVDQMRFDALGPMLTPNLHKLYLEGARFNFAYTSTPSCTPARAAILTGLSPWRHGMLGYGDIAKRYPVQMPSILKRLGYTTIAIGKNHFGWDKSKKNFTPYKHGYDRVILYDGIEDEPDDYRQWFRNVTGLQPESGWPLLDMNSWEGENYLYDESLHPTAWVGREAVKKILKLERSNSPWFLKVSFHRPHSPYDPPKRVLDTIKYVQPPVTCNTADPLSWDEIYANAQECGPCFKDAWCGRMPLDKLYAGRRAYAASMRFVDEWIGEMFIALRESNQLERTFILFASDHGDALGDHYLWRKTYPYDVSARIPFIIRWPAGALQKMQSAKRGVCIDRLVELRDIFPTFLDASGAAHLIKELNLDGGSLLSLFTENCQWRQVIDLEHSATYNRTNNWNALTDGQIKYIYNAFFPIGHPFREQLFNLSVDPYECRDLARLNDLNSINLLNFWRARLVRHFIDENRGDRYVKDNNLVQRMDGILYSPNYPSGNKKTILDIS